MNTHLGMRILTCATAAVLGVALSGCCRGLAPNPATCLRRRGCVPPLPLSTCSSETVAQARAVEQIAADAARLKGQEVVVRGRLRRATGLCTLAGCPGSCCNRCSFPLELRAGGKTRSSVGGQPVGIRVPYGCTGDESLTCCTLPTDKDAVFRGTLAERQKRGGRGISRPRYHLRHATVCVVGNATEARPRPRPTAPRVAP